MEFSLLNLLLILLSAWVAGALVARLGYPAIFGELLVGIVLGPPLLGWLHGSDALAVLAEIGVLLMMLYIGMEIDPKELFKASWAGFLAAIGGFIVPFALCYAVVTMVFGGTALAGAFVGIAAGVTSLATKSRILSDLNLLDTRIAHVMMAGALVADSLSLIIFAAIISVVDIGTLEASRMAIVGFEVGLFFALTIFTGLKVFPILWKLLSRWGLANRTFYATFLLIITIFFAEMAHLAGLHAILGAFLAGLFIREGVGVERRLAHELTELVRDMSIGFLAPIFFVTAGFHVDVNVFFTSLPLLISVTILATVGKIAGTALFYLWSGNGWREGITIGAGMNGRGAVEIIIAEIALQAGIITPEIFSVLVFMAIFTTATVPVFLKWGTDWLRGRGELRRSSDDRTGLVIVGAGTTARAIAKVLSKSIEPIWLVDNNMDHCNKAKDEGLNAIYGDAINEDNLVEAQISDARWVLALTPNTEVNVLVAQHVRNAFAVPEIFVLLTRTEEGALQSMVADIPAKPINNTDIDLSHWDELLHHKNDIEPVEIEVDTTIDVYRLLEQVRNSHETFLPVAISRNGQWMPFASVKSLDAGDKLIILQAE